MAPSYSYASYTDAIVALNSRLFDYANQQWTQAELTGYLNEALRTWNAMSGFWRSEMVFPLLGNTWWYDLRTQPNSIIPYTVTQYDLITQIENHLLEPPTPGAWTGSNQFTLNDLLIALQRRQDDVLGTTGCTISRALYNAAINIRTELPDNVIDIRRIAWLPTPLTQPAPSVPTWQQSTHWQDQPAPWDAEAPSINVPSPYANKVLHQSDMWANQSFDSYYTTEPEAAPSTWMQNTEPPPSFDVDRVPPVTGAYEVLSVNSGGQWAQGINLPLAVPDDWAWVVKWGALFDLLSRESNAKDVLRAEYCRRRFEEGMALMEMMPTVLALRMNNVPLAVDSVRNGDDFNPAWQSPAGLTWAEITETWASATFTWNASTGPVNSAYVTGNLIAFNSISPGTSATVSVTQNAPVGGTYIQVARDCFDSIIDIAHHLAMFKAGGAEFAATIPLYQRAQRKAAQYNSKLKEMGFFSMPQLELSVREEQQRPRYLPGAGPQDNG